MATDRTCRPGRSRALWRALAVLVVVASATMPWWALPARAQGLGFTVQVIAVSDQANALDISRGLLRDGFPAYVVRSTGAQGDVYRVRVGAFGNRAAAARYAAAMPDVGGARPVPALAEAIPAGIMPLAPRVLWQAQVGDGDLRVLPWPDGIALRRQANGPLRQATYDLVQGGEVRSVAAWRLAPLAVLPPSLDLFDVPFIDTTVAANGAPDDGAPDDGAPDDGAPDEPPPTEGAPAVGAPAEEASGAPAGAADRDPSRPRWADVGPGVAAEVGLVLLRDRSLWPPARAGDGDEVRAAFRAATLTLVANRVGLTADEVDTHAYLPAGRPPPALIVLEISDRSGRDLGDVRALGAAQGGIRPDGPRPVEGVDLDWWPAVGEGVRVDPDLVPGAPVGGPAWSLAADAGFVRIATSDGANWRAVAGSPLWSDGTYALVRDGDELLLFDFLPR